MLEFRVRGEQANRQRVRVRRGQVIGGLVVDDEIE